MIEMTASTTCTEHMVVVRARGRDFRQRFPPSLALDPALCLPPFRNLQLECALHIERGSNECNCAEIIVYMRVDSLQNDLVKRRTD